MTITGMFGWTYRVCVRSGRCVLPLFVVSVLAFALSLFATVGPLGTSTAQATTTTLTFPYDGLTGVEGVPQFWKVPPKVYYATFRVLGAQGGRGPGRPFNTGLGGRGGEVTATLAVKPGELLEINVGGMPGNGKAGGLLGVFGSGGSTAARRAAAALPSRVVAAGARPTSVVRRLGWPIGCSSPAAVVEPAASAAAGM